MSLLVPDAEAMEALGRNLRHPENWRGVVWLQGDLGAGKTTLVRSLLRGLGYEGRVKSPTYTLVEPYELDDRTVYHLDLYRLDSAEELGSIGIEEIQASGAVLIVEWGERLPAYMRRGAIRIRLHDAGEDSRRLEVLPDDQVVTDPGADA